MTDTWAPPQAESGERESGRLTAGWWLGLVLLWVGLLVGYAYVAGAARYIATPPWWADRMAVLFAFPVIALLAAALGQAWARWVSLGASIVLLVIGLLDLRTSPGVAVFEIALGLGALLASVASLVDNGAVAPPEDDSPIPS